MPTIVPTSLCGGLQFNTGTINVELTDQSVPRSLPENNPSTYSTDFRLAFIDVDENVIAARKEGRKSKTSNASTAVRTIKLVLRSWRDRRVPVVLTKWRF